MLVEADLIAFSNACFEVADERPGEAQHGSLANLPKILAGHLMAFRRLLLWGSARRHLLVSSLCCHATLISAPTGPTHSCAPRGCLEHDASSAVVEKMAVSHVGLAMSLMRCHRESRIMRLSSLS